MKPKLYFFAAILTNVNVVGAMSGPPIHLKDTEDGRCDRYSGSEYVFTYNKPCKDVIIKNEFVRFSDSRLKENEKPIVNSLKKLQEVPFYSFNYINQPEIKYGVLAQELQAQFPKLVTEAPTGEENAGFLQVNYFGLAIIAMQALKEANEKVDSLEIRIMELERRSD